MLAKVFVVYDTKYGNTKLVAEKIVEGMSEVEGIETAISDIEKAALEIMSFLEGCGYPSLIIHTEDEFDPINRIGLLSLKVLAKEAGLGWQGRSLLIVSPEYGPIHRLIAILTNIPLIANRQK